jgi:hypothetical protein
MGSARDTLTHFKSSVKRFKQYLFLVQNQTDCWPNNLSGSSCTDLAKLYHCTHFKRSVKPGQLRAAEQAICMHGNKEAQAEFRRFNLDFGLSQVFMRHGWCPKQHLLVFMRHGWCTQSTESVAYARISEHWPAEKRSAKEGLPGGSWHTCSPQVCVFKHHLVASPLRSFSVEEKHY